ncbi:MAG: cytochrome c oxidase assembly protein [Rhodomicrobiaceae bacterium]
MTESHAEDSVKQASKANRRLAFRLLSVVAVMIGLSFAAVPLYQLFCQVTGYAGTPQRADAPSTQATNRVISIRFDANTSSELAWSFQPVENRIDLRIGENRLAFYKAANRADKPLTGTATFNVTPELAGAYFNKVDCFCFIQQTLGPGQEVDMPVSFFIDPAILDDPDARSIEEITLSYTFFKVEMEDKSAVDASQAEGAATRSFEKGQQPG